MPSKLRLVLLDYDLTLMNNAVDFYTAFTDALRELGTTHNTTFNEFYKLLGEDRLEDLIPPGIDKGVLWSIIRERICSSRAVIPNTGVEYFLQIAKLLGLKTVVITGRTCHPKYIAMDLEKAGLDHYFDGIYTFHDMQLRGVREEVLFDKSWMIKRVVEENGVEPREAVFVADYELDYYSSVKAGVWFIAYLGHEARYEIFRKLGASYIARNFYEAASILIELCRKV